MEKFCSLEKSIEYIENNLKNDFTIEELSKEIGISKFYFQRVFQEAVGDPISTYIRYRRLDSAYKELLMGDSKIVNIAIDYQFGSHEAFIRAFRKRYGYTPSKIRKIKPKHREYKKFSLDMQNNDLSSFSLREIETDSILPEVIYGFKRTIWVMDYSISREIIRNAREILRVSENPKIYLYVNNSSKLEKYFLGVPAPNNKMESCYITPGRTKTYSYYGSPRRILSSLLFLKEYWLPKKKQPYNAIVVEYNTNPAHTSDYEGRIYIITE